MYKLVAALAVFFFAFILWVIYLANTNSSNIFFDFIDTLPMGDKIGHFCLFGLLTFLAIVSLKFRTLKLGKYQLYWGVALVVTFVVLEEISQAFIASRTFDLTDLSADFFGIATASLFTYIAHHFKHK